MMATHLNTVQWKNKTLPQEWEQDTSSSLHLPITSKTIPLPTPDLKTNSSFLHSQHLKQHLLYSKATFLGLTSNNPIVPGHIIGSSNNAEQKKAPIKKISFKVKKTASIYRWNGLTNQKVTVSKVAELTNKFNGMISEENNSILEQPKYRKFIKRVNSQRSSESDKVSKKSSVRHNVVRKPSVKTKPDKELLMINNRRRTCRIIDKQYDKTNSNNTKMCVRAKISYLETPQVTSSPTTELTQRPKSLSICEVSEPKLHSPTAGTVKAAIEIFERRSSESSPTQCISLSNNTLPKLNVLECAPSSISETISVNKDELVQIVNIPAILPQRRCDSMYETRNLKRIAPPEVTKSSENMSVMKPNTSFLWSIHQDKSPSASHSTIITNEPSDTIYDFVDPKAHVPELPPKAIQIKPPTPPKKTFKKIEEKVYADLVDDAKVDDGYEYCETDGKYEVIKSKINTDDDDDGYEYCASPDKDNIYETLPAPPTLPKRQQLQPLPPRPPSRNSNCTIQSSENVSNCYESIYNSNTAKVEVDSNYESIYGCQLRLDTGSNRDSLVSSDQQSNSLYGRASLISWGDDGSTIYNGKAVSDVSYSDKSDEWVDMTDNEDNSNNHSGIIIIREKHKFKKSSGWSQRFREQRTKSSKRIPNDQGQDSELDHHYESLSKTNREECQEEDFDSFDSDSESEISFTQLNLNDSGVDIANSQLPEPPTSQTYVLTRLAATAGKHMRKFRRNWSLTKNDISKSLSRMTKRKSRTDLEVVGDGIREEIPKSSRESEQPLSHKSYQNIEYSTNSHPEPQLTDSEKGKTLTKKGFLNKFRRSMSLSAESATELTSNLGNKPKSTFYLTGDIDIDEKCNKETENSGITPVQRRSRTPVIRPQSPPPPAPTLRTDKRATSWYTEVGLFKNSENNQTRRPNTFWYAEVGLYQTSSSTPSTSSAENSGTNPNTSIKTEDFINSEEYYNMKNDTDFYNNSMVTLMSSSETNKDQSLTSLTPDIQLRLQDEPLYQFYDAAILESVCHDGTSDFDSDGYEEVGDRSNSRSSSSSSNSESHQPLRPSAMELVSPNGNSSLLFTRTLWCEIPEVINSSVLSTLSTHQKKLQEAKFEMITSEASYLKSLNVLHDHFIVNFEKCELVSQEELNILFGKVGGVKNCSEKLLWDLEKCWQDNILLYGVCDVVQKHAEENFCVYVSYCENQILLDDTLKRLKERPGFLELLKQLESSSACQSLTLYSFLMLPMQRITRWPLLVDAVLKRLSPQDSEYLTCQFALATINKTVSQCNEGARRKERENEMKKILNQLEFAKGVPPIEIISDNRWLIRSGSVSHMQQRSDEIKLTFGKRFSKTTLHLFLFNDFLFVTKPKNEYLYVIIHYCPRNLVELNSTDSLVSLPLKETQGRHLLFLTILENQIGKTVEFLLSCSSESDKERWMEALRSPKSEDPNETLYECWDCPQVTAVHNYVASQPDELALCRGDVINVLRKMADAWYHGERIRDGQTGWFPANYTREIANPHVRSRNLKQRYRLLAFSENYLKTK